MAFQQADYVAWNLWASINQRPVLEFRYQHLGTMMSYGSSTGAVALPIPIPEGTMCFHLRNVLDFLPIGSLLV